MRYKIHIISYAFFCIVPEKAGYTTGYTKEFKDQVIEVYHSGVYPSKMSGVIALLFIEYLIVNFHNLY